MAARSTSLLRIIVICAAVFALLVAAAGIAVADDPPTTDETTEVTEPTTETTVDTTPDTTEDTTPTTTEDTTPTTEPEETTFGALDVGTQAATADRVTVHKVVQPGDPAEDFPVALRRCSNTSCSSVSNSAPTVNETHDVPAGGSVDFSTPLVNGSRYRLVEQLPSGWRFISATCTGTPSGSGSQLSYLFAPPGVRFVHTTNTAWDCYFTNANSRVTIQKISDGPDPAQITLQRCETFIIFACVDWETVNSSSYGNGDSMSFTSLDASGNAFRVLEDVPDGYRLTNVTCGSGTLPNFTDIFLTYDGLYFALDASTPSRTCTFTNTQNRITITKATDPVGAPRDFTVNLEKCDVNILTNCLLGFYEVDGSPATLQDAGSSVFTGGDLADQGLFNRFFRVSEDDPGSGWDVDVSCSGQFGIGSPVDGDLSQAFTFSLNGNIPAVADCTVTNTTETGSITVAKVTDPAGGKGFDFSFDDLDDPSDPAPIEVTLNDDESGTFENLFPSGKNGYEITETSLPDGWSLDDISCPDADVDVDLPNNTVAVFLERGQEVTCMFTNTNPLEPAISLTKTPDLESAVVGDTITYTYVVTNEGPVEVTDLTLVDTPLGDVALDSTTLAPTGEPGDTATGTLTRDVADEDAGTTITNTALATGFVSCNPEVEVCAAERGVTEVTAEADASVDVAAVGGEVVTNDPVGVGSATTGQLPFTGSSTRGPILGALGLLVAGGLLVLLDQKRRQGLGV